MKRTFAGLTCGIWLGLGLVQAAWAESAVVVELYTSQGCSSCPPADAFLATLLNDPGVIPLALHVDYWDYIGWKDSFGNPKFTDRQRAYAHVDGSKTIYTPQMIVGGSDRAVGNDEAKIKQAIRNHQEATSPVSLHLTRTGAKVTIYASSSEVFAQPLRVQLVRYLPQETVEIGRGENAGLTMTYHNIVTAWSTVVKWNGKTDLTVDADVAGPEAVVVIVQEDGPGMIYAAEVMH